MAPNFPPSRTNDPDFLQSMSGSMDEHRIDPFLVFTNSIESPLMLKKLFLRRSSRCYSGSMEQQLTHRTT